jgi:hypothetical protein
MRKWKTIEIIRVGGAAPAGVHHGQKRRGRDVHIFQSSGRAARGLSTWSTPTPRGAGHRQVMSTEQLCGAGAHPRPVLHAGPAHTPAQHRCSGSRTPRRPS